MMERHMTTVCIMQAAGKATQPASQTYIQPARRLVTARQAGGCSPTWYRVPSGPGTGFSGGPKLSRGTSQ